MNTERIVLCDVNVRATVAHQISAAKVGSSREVARNDEVTRAVEDHLLAVVVEGSAKAFGLYVASDAGHGARAAAIHAGFAAVQRAVVAMRRQAHVDGGSEAEAGARVDLAKATAARVRGGCTIALV